MCNLSAILAIIAYVQQRCNDVHMEAAAFKVGEYNKQVMNNYPGDTGRNMTLHYPDNTIAFTVIYNSVQYQNYSDAVDAFQSEYERIVQQFPGQTIRYIDANAMQPPPVNLPVVHVQTAGSASGTAFYYQKTQVTDPPATWVGKSIFGISINNNFRLGTVFTAVLVFETLQDCPYKPQLPCDVYKSQAEKVMLLSYVNGLTKPPL